MREKQSQSKVLYVPDMFSIYALAVDQLLINKRQEIDELNKKMEDLKINADAWDYYISALSGIVAGIVDIVFVGGLKFKSLSECNEIGSNKINDIVKKFAKYCGYKEDPNLSDEENLKKAIQKLQNYHLASDQKIIKDAMGGATQHHFRDFTHHPTIVGWICSLIMQFSGGYVIGTNPGGMLIIRKVEETTWIGKDPFQKVLFGTVHWALHMISDIAGTNLTAGRGTGLPGPLLSLAKELDAIRVRLFNGNAKTGQDADALTKFLSKLFNGTAFAKHDADGKIIKGTELRFDYRTEIGMLENVKEASKMFIPVLINECIVRTFFFIKRFVIAVKETQINSLSGLETLDWKRILPFNNATLIRMLTVSVEEDKDVDSLPCWSAELEPSGSVARIAVAPDEQNKGYGRIMLQYAMDELKRRGYRGIHFLVNKHNVKAIRSYAVFGFEVVGECHLFGQDFLCYQKGL